MKNLILIILMILLLINGIIIGKNYVKTIKNVMQQEQQRIELAVKN